MGIYIIFTRNSSIKRLDIKNTIEVFSENSFNRLKKGDMVFLYIKYDSKIYNISYKVLSKEEKEPFYLIRLSKHKKYNQQIDFKKDKIFFRDFIKKLVLDKSLGNIELVKLSSNQKSILEGRLN